MFAKFFGAFIKNAGTFGLFRLKKKEMYRFTTAFL